MTRVALAGALRFFRYRSLRRDLIKSTGGCVRHPKILGIVGKSTVRFDSSSKLRTGVVKCLEIRRRVRGSSKDHIPTSDPTLA